MTGQVVHTLAFNNGTRVVTETQSVHTGTAFAETLSTTSGLADRDVLAVAFSSGTDRRVISVTDALTQQAVAFTYTNSGVRTTDLLSGDAGSIYAIVATDSLGAERRFEYAVNSGRIYSIIHTPSSPLKKG